MNDIPVNTQNADAAREKTPSRRSVAALAATALAATSLCVAGGGCDGADPTGPPGLSVPGPSGTIPALALHAGPWPAGDWRWTWRSAAGDTALTGRAELAVRYAGGTARWKWSFAPRPPAGRPLELLPADPDRWLAQRWNGTAEPGPVPLPRLAVASGHYADLTDLLRELTRPRFGGVVGGWSADPAADRRAGPPYPVDPGHHVAGAVDLSACLRRAMAIWNLDAPGPWFVEAPGSAWGVRLIHYPGRDLRPPLYAQLTRLDRSGRPARVNIYAGDNYADPGDSVYALHGLVHELGHALLLWGHSADRSHSLWGRAPPQVSVPSLDERKAARLWHGLPEGVDLRDYWIVTPP